LHRFFTFPFNLGEGDRSRRVFHRNVPAAPGRAYPLHAFPDVHLRSKILSDKFFLILKGITPACLTNLYLAFQCHFTKNRVLLSS
jgi:hypothetical protein